MMRINHMFWLVSYHIKNNFALIVKSIIYNSQKLNLYQRLYFYASNGKSNHEYKGKPVKESQFEV